MNTLVIYTCSNTLCSRITLSSLQIAVIGVSLVVALVVIYLIVSFGRIPRTQGITVVSSSPDPETVLLRSQYTLEEYTQFLNWQMQMGIIGFMEYDDLYAKGLPFLR